MSPVVFAFSFGVSLLSGLLFGLIPILKRAGCRISIRTSRRRTHAQREPRTASARNTLVVVQVALAPCC